MKDVYTSTEVVTLLDLNRNSLTEWLRLGYVTPSINPSQGRGNRLRYSREDLYYICLFKWLNDQGHSRESIKIMLDRAKAEVSPDEFSSISHLVLHRQEGGQVSRLEKIYTDAEADNRQEERAGMNFVITWTDRVSINLDKVRHYVDSLIDGNG